MPPRLPAFPGLSAKSFLVFTAFVIAPASIFAQAISPLDYKCFDATQTTGIGQAFTGTCLAESPFAQAQRGGDFQYFHFEDWESFALNSFTDPIPVSVPGVVVSAGGGGGVTTGGFSPDADDGVIDDVSDGTVGLQTAFTVVALPGVSVFFDAQTLGQLPTHTAIVVTSRGGGGDGEVTAEFFSPSGNSLGTVVRQFAAATSAADSSDDAFMGWTDPGGIESITVRVTLGTGGFNFDHLQYGLIPPRVPVASDIGRAVLFILIVVAGMIVIARSQPART